MNKDSERDEVAEWFHQLRQIEERTAPPFDRVLNAARARVARRQSHRLYYIVGAAAALFAFLVAPVPWRQGTGVPPVQTTSISQWKSPTDFLIDTPGQKLLKTVPRIGDGFIDMRALDGEEKR